MARRETIRFHKAISPNLCPWPGTPYNKRTLAKIVRGTSISIYRGSPAAAIRRSLVVHYHPQRFPQRDSRLPD